MILLAKRLLGILLLLATFGALFCGTALTYGWGTAALVWGISTLCTGLIVLGIYLLVMSDR